MKIHLLLLSLMLAGCEPAGTPDEPDSTAPRFKMSGKLESGKLNEASGLQAGENGIFFVHNDDGEKIFAIDASGSNLAEMKINGARNKDWEDLTRVMGEEGPLLVIADTGDNHSSRKKVRLYFVKDPSSGVFPDELDIQHELDVRYSDGPRDVEAVAYDSSNEMILFLSKRDKPPRLYGVPLDLALWEDEVEAQFLAEVPGFRPPTQAEIFLKPKRGLWLSQPTGMDISKDGRSAAVITYRSLYLFTRQDGETWPEAFQREPIEFVGPPGSQEEAVAFGHDPDSIFITTEGRPAPVYQLVFEHP